ncbi:MAG: ACP phosphodiesterase [Acidobacteriota bacterium]
MNYLGHLYLAEDTAHSLVGNLLGDFVKGSIPDQFPDEIRKGILLHRRVDSFTDSHPVFRESLRMFSPARRRFAGIMLDIFYDHYLAKHWATYSKVALDQFSQKVYQVLRHHYAILPERLQRMLPYIIEEDWLTSYQELDTIDRTLRRLAKRFKRRNDLMSGIEELHANYEFFESGFHDFFPAVIHFVENQRKTLNITDATIHNGEKLTDETLGR